MRTFALFAVLTLTAPSTFAAVPAAELPVADHLVYLRELPESTDLITDATANGLTVMRLDRTSDRVVITYGYPDGHTATMGYALLSAASNGDWVAPKPARESERTVKVVSSEPEVIYYKPRYRTRYVYRDPIDSFWLPLTLGVGLGWATGHHGHHGHHGGWHGRGHVGW